MNAPKTLRKPSNWQDFESLCKKLWGEIWQCPEIQKNGRLGQNQYGVDIFGVPKGEDGYYGIQCKGKSEYNDNQYSHPQFTQKELITEIELAKHFEPKLKKLYFATTALNDSKTQAFIRKKNLELISDGLFEVHLFCWESIVDLIDENKKTHNWYVNSNNYKVEQGVEFTFNDSSTAMLGLVPFYQKVTTYKLKDDDPNNFPDLLAKLKNSQPQLFVTKFNFGTYKKNHSNFTFSFRLHNTGNVPIEDYKIFLTFTGEFKTLERVSRGGGSYLAPRISWDYNIFIFDDGLEGKIIPLKEVLVGGDFINSDKIIIYPKPIESEIIIKWKLVSRDFTDEGELKLILNPEIRKDFNTEIVVDPELVRVEEGPIEDYTTEEKGGFMYGL